MHSPLGSRPSLTTQTKLFGHLSNATEYRLLGGVVDIINNELDKYSSDALYVPLQVSPDNLASVINGMISLRYFGGFTVTMPHKAEAAGFCHRLLPNALASSSVNAIRVEDDGSLTGESFDGLGMLKAIENCRLLTNSTNVLILGAGGVGQAIAVALATTDISNVHIKNRTYSKANVAAEKANTVSRDAKVKAIIDPQVDEYDIIIQATSIGSGNGTGSVPIDLRQAKSDCLIVEAVRTPEITNFLLDAQKLNLEYVKGNDMLLPQIHSIMQFLKMI
jgi:shikimate dehydrogenase